jgi:hypothetical protein
MLFPKYVLEDLSVGSGSIIGKSNIEEFFNHIMWMKYNALLTKLLQLILMLLLMLLDSQFSAPSSKALKKSTLGR